VHREHEKSGDLYISPLSPYLVTFHVSEEGEEATVNMLSQVLVSVWEYEEGDWRFEAFDPGDPSRVLAESPARLFEEDPPRFTTVEEATVAACVVFGPERVVFGLEEVER
jgi:hypothetical protein